VPSVCVCDARSCCCAQRGRGPLRTASGRARAGPTAGQSSVSDCSVLCRRDSGAERPGTGKVPGQQEDPGGLQVELRSCFGKNEQVGVCLGKEPGESFCSTINLLFCLTIRNVMANRSGKKGARNTTALTGSTRHPLLPAACPSSGQNFHRLSFRCL